MSPSHRLYSAILLALMQFAPLQAGEPVTLLALGDSITQGGKNFSCYREFLIPQLRARKLPFRFVGPKQDQTSAHAGYGGQNTRYLRESVHRIYTAHPADIVLLHSGHNSFGANRPVPGIIRDTDALIETIHAINPDATVLLAQVITAGKLPKYSYIPELNRQLRILAGQLTARGRKVILVDQATGFDWRTDTVKDKVHPNAAGAKKMAANWLRALLAIMAKSDIDPTDTRTRPIN
jgi:acyl-CoA thioesterase I